MTVVSKKTSIPWAVRLSWLENARLRSLFPQAVLTRKVGQTDLVLGRWSGFISRFDKSLCAAVTICCTMVITSRHMHIHKCTHQRTQTAFLSAYM